MCTRNWLRSHLKYIEVAALYMYVCALNTSTFHFETFHRIKRVIALVNNAFVEYVQFNARKHINQCTMPMALHGPKQIANRPRA